MQKHEVHAMLTTYTQDAYAMLVTTTDLDVAIRPCARSPNFIRCPGESVGAPAHAMMLHCLSLDNVLKNTVQC